MMQDIVYRYTDTPNDAYPDNHINFVVNFISPITGYKPNKYIFIKFNKLPANDAYLEFEGSSSQYKFFDYLKIKGFDTETNEYKPLSKNYSDLIYDNNTNQGILFTEITGRPGFINSSISSYGDLFPNITNNIIDINNNTIFPTNIDNKWFYIDANKYSKLRFSFNTDSTNTKQGWDMFITSTDNYSLENNTIMTGQQLYVSKKDFTKLTNNIGDAYLVNNKPIDCGKILSTENYLIKI